VDGPDQRGRDAQAISVDIVVPVRNEAENIEPFLASIEALPLPPEVALSVIFIEDGSSDGTVELLRAISQRDARVRFYSIETGFGEGPAIVYGLSRSSADAMIMMAVESHPPVLIPAMIQAFRRGARVVQCVRDSLSGRSRRRDAMTSIYPGIIRLLTGFDYHAQNVYYRLVSRDFALEILESPRFWRFIRFPLPDPESGALEVVHANMQERDRGDSEYGIFRLVAFGGDGIIAWMSNIRLFAVTLAAVSLAGLLTAAGLTALATALMILVLLIAARFVWIRNTDYLTKMIAKESSNAAR